MYQLNQKTMRKQRSKFLKVKCHDCNNEQLIFNKASMVVKCSVCGATLAKPTGGMAVIKSKIIEVVDRKNK